MSWRDSDVDSSMEPTTTYHPALVSWNLTKRCNLSCPHCYLDAGERAETELSTEECFSILDEMDSLGTEMLILTGGEPLLRRDIYEIASRASGKGMWVVMGTNGMLITDHVAGLLVDHGVKGVGISIDSVDPGKHNRFRGSPNAWQLAVRAIETCRMFGLEVIVHSTVVSETVSELADLLEFARSRGAWSFNAFFLVRTGRGVAMSDLSPEQTDECLRFLVGNQEAYAPMFVRAKCAPHFKQLAYEMGKPGMESGGCMAGIDYCRITPAGNVTPCPYMPVVAGNARESGLTRVWQQSPVLRALRDLDRMKGKCGICDFRDLCGGCRCRAYSVSGEYLAEDSACLYQPYRQVLTQLSAQLSSSVPGAWSLPHIPTRSARGDYCL